MTITCDVTKEDHDLVNSGLSKHLSEEQKVTKLIGLSFVFGGAIFLSNSFFDYEHDHRFWIIGMPIALILTFFSYLYISSNKYQRRLAKPSRDTAMRGHLGKNTFTIETNGLRESNERGEHFTKWRFIDDIQIHLDCTFVRTGVLVYTIPNRTTESGVYEQFIDKLITRWNENKG